MVTRWTYLAAILGLLAFPAMAERYPSRVITMVVPYPAGGPTDLVARIIAGTMSKELGQQVIVENVGGASGTIGTLHVVRANPDGYTLLLHNLSLATAPFLYKKHTYDVLKDFSPIALVAETPQVIVAKKTVAATNVTDLIAYIEKEKKNINLADAGRGSGSFLCNLFFAHAVGAQMTAVSYTGTAPALTDLLAGRVDMMCDQVSNTEKQIEAGNIKAYCVTAHVRVDTLPSVPTCEEAGLQNVEASVWVALLGPAGLTEDVVAKLASAVQQALHDPSVAKKFGQFATTVVSGDLATPTGLQAFLKKESTKWRQTFEAMHVEPQ